MRKSSIHNQLYHQRTLNISEKDVGNDKGFSWVQRDAGEQKTVSTVFRAFMSQP